MQPFLGAQAAAVKIVIPDVGGCSGAYVSDEGHILTASHCVEACGATCDLEIDGLLTPVKILMRSRCAGDALVGSGKRRLPWRSPPKACYSSADVAILLPLRPSESVRCLPIQTEFIQGEPLYALGYPAATRRGADDANGVDLYRSDGEIIAYAPQCTMVANGEPVEWMLRISQPGSVRALSPWGFKYLVSRGFLQTTVDVTPGSSGGPLINTRDEVIAVVHGMPLS